jgi:CHAD domain-containing protein
MTALPAEPASGSAKSKLPRLAKKRLERFVTLYPKALVSDKPEVVHDLRVASRRLQQTLRLLLPNAKSSANKKLLRLLRRVRRAFGSCRNLDVSIHLIESKLAATTTASLRSAWDAVRLWLEEQRAAEIERGRAELKRHDLTDFISRTQARMENIDEEPQTGALAERARDAFGEWREALTAAKEEPQNERIHALRIAGKRLRYQLEAIAELGDLSVKQLLDGLKALQDDLGSWHDRSVVRDLVAEFIGRPGFLAEEPGMCRALLLDMEREKQRDHLAIADVITKADELAEQNAMVLDAEAAVEGEVNKDQ